MIYPKILLSRKTHLIVIMLLIAIVACNGNAGIEDLAVDVTVTASSLEVTSTVAAPTAPVLPTFYPVESIKCVEPLSIETSSFYIVDEIVPGQSVKDDVLALLGTPTEEMQWNGILTWLYTSQERHYTIKFVDNEVLSRNEPRFNLAEIIGHYGMPNEAYWRLPKVSYHGAIPRTYLLYPNQGALFAEEEQIVEFSPSTLFRESYIVEPSQFEELLDELNVLVETEYDRYVRIEWPC